MSYLNSSALWKEHKRKENQQYSLNVFTGQKLMLWKRCAPSDTEVAVNHGFFLLQTCMYKPENFPLPIKYYSHKDTWQPTLMLIIFSNHCQCK